MYGAFFECSKVVFIVKKSDKKKRKKKKSNGYNCTEEEGKIPTDGISATEWMMISSVYLGRKCN